jgi:hypothetical protein
VYGAHINSKMHGGNIFVDSNSISNTQKPNDWKVNVIIRSLRALSAGSDDVSLRDLRKSGDASA